MNLTSAVAAAAAAAVTMSTAQADADRHSSLLRLGALITILALALDPFAQQLVHFELQQPSTPNTHTTIARAQRYSQGNRYSIFGTTYASAQAAFPMQSAILYGITHPYNTVVRQLPFNCPSGNCTWDPFESLAICSVCNDVRNQLTTYDGDGDLWVDLAKDNPAAVNGPGKTFRLPNGLLLNNNNGSSYAAPEFGFLYMTTYGTGVPSGTVSFQDHESLIWGMSFIKAQAPSNHSAVWPNVEIEALECGLYYCVKQYTPTVENGILHEEENPVANASRVPDSWQVVDFNYGKVDNGTNPNSIVFNNITSGVERTDLEFGNNYNVSQAAVDGISAYFQATFKSTMGGNYENQNLTSSGESAILNGFYLNDGTIQYSPTILDVLYKSPDLNETFSSIARSMSNAMRTGADNGTVQTGAVLITTTNYHIKWPWITLHAALLIAAAVFLITTIHRSGRMNVPVWKSNSLAILSRRAEIGDLLEGDESIPHMNMKSSGHYVQLFGEKRHSQSEAEARGLVAEQHMHLSKI